MVDGTSYSTFHNKKGRLVEPHRLFTFANPRTIGSVALRVAIHLRNHLHGPAFRTSNPCNSLHICCSVSSPHSEPTALHRSLSSTFKTVPALGRISRNLCTNSLNWLGFALNPSSAHAVRPPSICTEPPILGL